MCSLVFFLYPAFFHEFTHGGGKVCKQAVSVCRKMTNYPRKFENATTDSTWARCWVRIFIFFLYPAFLFGKKVERSADVLYFRIIAYNSVSIINPAQSLPVSPGKQPLSAGWALGCFFCHIPDRPGCLSASHNTSESRFSAMPAALRRVRAA